MTTQTSYATINNSISMNVNRYSKHCRRKSKNDKKKTCHRHKQSCGSSENSSAASTTDSEQDQWIDNSSDLLSLVSCIDIPYYHYSGKVTREMESMIYLMDLQLRQIALEREQVLSKLRQCAALSFQEKDQVDFEIFGSVSTNLALPSSDVDCVMTYDAMRWTQTNASIIMLNKLAKTLETVEAFQELNLLLSAKVPVLKFKYPSNHGHLLFDITSLASSQHSGAQARQLVQEFMQTMPALRPLVLILKAHLRTYGLNEPFTGGLASYAIVLLTIRFLQYMQLVYDCNHLPISACHCTNCVRCQKNYEIQHMDIGYLLIQWLQFYTQFDYARFGITISNKGSYFTLKYENVTKVPWIDDPFRPGMNMCSSFRMQEVLQSWRHLLNNLQNQVPLSQLVSLRTVH